MAVQACTIVARNYLAAARVLATSFMAHHPDGRISVLVIDDINAEIDASTEAFDLLGLDDLQIERDELLRMLAIYNVMEFCTAVKPWLIKALHDRGASSVLYLDPDIKVFGPLDDLAHHAESHQLVLTPHVTQPLPRDGLNTSEDEILSSGIFNLGFVGVGCESAALLTYWMERLRRDCITDPREMRFVDQRWMDFTPAFFSPFIDRSTTYNVAYWNLMQRKFDVRDGAYVVDGAPLKFFHFSGYDPRVPYLLSKHQGPSPRVLLSEHPALRQICDEYGADLLAAGYEQGMATPYGYARLSSGTIFDGVMRKVYRSALIAAEEAHRPLPPNPMTEVSDQRFIDWLNEIPEGGPFRHLSRYLTATYFDRPDLRDVFPDPDQGSFDKFAEWSRHDASVGRLDARLAVPERTATAVPSGPLVPGIRVAGYLRAETGVGELGRLAIETVNQAGIESATYVDTHSVSRQQHAFEMANRSDLNVNLVCVNADEFRNFARRVGPTFYAGRYTIGLWAWEIEEFPDQFLQSFAFADEIWTISEFSRAAISARTSKPVINFPLPIVPPVPRAGVTKDQLGLPAGYTFLFCFDLMSIVERKNPFGLIDAFSRAFAPGEGPTLVIKAINSTMKTGDLERLKFAAMGRNDIQIIDRYLDADENAALMNLCDCYVSLHRSEGFGLTMGEAMALGKPVIATAYSGNLDFMNDETAYLVPWTYGEIPAGCEPYPKGAKWAEPDLDVAAQLMRKVFTDPVSATAVGQRAAAFVRNEHGVAARTKIVTERFHHAQHALATGATTAGANVAATIGGTQAGATSPALPMTAKQLLRRVVGHYLRRLRS